MKYVLFVFETENQLADRNDPSRQAAYWASYIAYGEALAKAGIMQGGAGLQPYTHATTVSNVNGKRLVQDGPFADTKEKLGGFYTIEVPDLDKALEWAARCPAATGGGKVEVRAVLQM